MSAECRNKRNCYCKGKHHTSICFRDTKSDDVIKHPLKKEDGTEVTNLTAAISSKANILLQTAKVKVLDSRKIHFRVILSWIQEVKGRT